LLDGTESFDNLAMPIPVVEIFGATAFVVLLGLTLWIIDEAYRRPGEDGPQSDLRP
jgi:hypothetical protein